MFYGQSNGTYEHYSPLRPEGWVVASWRVITAVVVMITHCRYTASGGSGYRLLVDRCVSLVSVVVVNLLAELARPYGVESELQSQWWKAGWCQRW